MSIYSWQGREEPLGRTPCVATSLTIDSLACADGRYRATGTIQGKDYVEHGIEFTDPWEAEAIETSFVGLSWSVKRKDDETAFWKNDKGEIFFTCNSAIEKGIKDFVASKLNHVLSLTEQGRESPIVDHQPTFSGERKKYEGACVCHILATRNNKQISTAEPFDRNTLLPSDQFPKDCFACSCGSHWWCYDPDKNLWGRVADDKAWEMLLQYDGVDVQWIDYIQLPDRGINGFMLMQSICDLGFIPL